MSQDYDEAVKWFRKSVEQDDAHGQFHLGECYEKGTGVPQDMEEALKWYRKAAEQENKEAIEALQRLEEADNPFKKVDTSKDVGKQ